MHQPQSQHSIEGHSSRKSVVQIESLTRDYGQNRGVFDVDINLFAGEVVGFIGPNGAGKSTTINMLTGLIEPGSGRLNLFGQHRMGAEIQGLKHRMGILYSEPVFPGFLTPETIFQRNARMREIPDSSWQAMATKLEVDLKRPFGSLSLGNRKKVGVVTALMHQPDLVIVDEPTSGLDPLVQKHFLELISEVKDRGGTVLLSSHVLSEVEAICDRIIMIKKGKIIKEEQTQELLNSLPRVFRLMNLTDDVLQKILQTGVIDTQQRVAQETRLYTQNSAPVLAILAEVGITDFFIERLSLEEMFLEYYS